MNRTLQEATVQRYHYDSHDQLRLHLADFLAAYNFAKRLQTLKGLSVEDVSCGTLATNAEIVVGPHEALALRDSGHMRFGGDAALAVTQAHEWNVNHG
jgi:hypothetical protein